MKGKLYGVSVGVGDGELLTLKAFRIISECKHIASLKTHGGDMTAFSIAKSVVDMSEKNIIEINYSMSLDKAKREQSRKNMAEKIFSQLDKGEDVACLCLGDISIYSSFSYIIDLAIESGYDVEIVPGITSFCAAAATVKKPLVQGNKPLIIIPQSADNFDSLLELDCNKIIMKSHSENVALSKKLENKQIFAVENCGMDNERIITAAKDL